jgi:hypothetical protein
VPEIKIFDTFSSCAKGLLSADAPFRSMCHQYYLLLTVEIEKPELFITPAIGHSRTVGTI